MIVDSVPGVAVALHPAVLNAKVLDVAVMLTRLWYYCGASDAAVVVVAADGGVGCVNCCRRNSSVQNYD